MNMVGSTAVVVVATATTNCDDSSRAMICKDGIVVALSNALGF